MKDYLDRAIIVDLDGTLAIITDRSVYDHSQSFRDELNVGINFVVQALSHTCRIILVTGREEKFRAITMVWLTQQGVKWDILLMRPAGDQRQDGIVKKELYEKYLKGMYDIVCVFEDRRRVVDMWREQGLLTFQVAAGDF